MIDGFRVQRVIRTHPEVSTVLEAEAPDGEAVMLTVLAPDRDTRRQTVRMARVRASIKHPNLLPFHGAHESRDHVYLVSSRPGPSTLADRLRAGPLDSDESLALLAQVAAGLETAARHGLVHRDLTPESISLTDERTPRAVLTDMGLAMPPAYGCELVGVGEGADYRSPEEVRGEPLTPESNVYSLACILVECLTRMPPFPYARPLLTLHAHVVEPPPRVSERNPDVPATLDSVVAKAMAKDPAARYDSPAGLIRAAGQALGTDPDIPLESAAPKKEIPPTPIASEPRPLRPRPRLGRLGLVLALFASVVGGLVAGSIDWSGDPRPAIAAPSPSPPDTDRVTRAAYVNAVASSVDRLRARRDAARRQLRAARRAAGQAAAATALARAYRDARRALPAPQPRVSGESRLAATLRGAELAYRRLARAAETRNHRAWRAARRETLRRERALEHMLREVRLS